MLPVVAIVGKPNVGKSTLFNRFMGYRKAIVSPTPGTTRDRHYGQVEGDKPFLLVDTGGIESKHEGIIEDNIVAQAQMAIEEAQIIVFLIDAKEGMTSEDENVAELLRKSGKPIILVASKSDSMRENIIDLLGLGFGDPMRVSADHYVGVIDLHERIEELLPEEAANQALPEVPEDSVRLAMIGRPNVGKSSLINTLYGQEKVIVSEIQGTTIDSTDIELEHDGQHYVLVDTAGIRRRGKIEKGIEKYSFLRSLRAADNADVVVLMIDGEEGVTAQDQHVANYVLQHHTGLILAVNKLDLMESGEEARNAFLHHLRYKFDFIPWAPVVFISAKTGKNTGKIFDIAKQIKEIRTQRIETSMLNRWLEKIMLKHAPSGNGRKIPKMFFITQVETEPPHFVVFVNNREYFHFSYIRYLENQLRESFGFEGTSIKIEFRNKEERSKQRPSKVRRKRSGKKKS